jgi:hypothetical protein
MQRLSDSCSHFDHLWVERRRIFDTQTLIKSLLHLCAGAHQSYHRVMDQIGLGTDFSPAASSFCEARAKLSPFVIGEIRRDLLDGWDEERPERFWHGYRPHAVDGTKVSLPRQLFAYGFKAPAGGHCPQGLVSLLVRLGDRLVCDIRLSKDENERHEAHEHLAHLAKSDLVVYDRGYLSFGLLVAHVRQGIGALFRVAKGTSFSPVERFWRSPKLEAIVTIDPTPVTYRSTKKQYPDYDLGPIRLRLIKYLIDGETYVLATTILAESIPRSEFVTLYAQRWSAEETFKTYKQTLTLETFHARSEKGVSQEIEATALLWNMSRMLGAMAEPAIKKKRLAVQFHRTTRSTFSRAF